MRRGEHLRARSDPEPVQGMRRWQHLPARSEKEQVQDVHSRPGRVHAAGSRGALTLVRTAAGFCHGSTRFCGAGGAPTVSDKPQQDRSHGSEGCGALDQHQHGRPPAPDQETVANFHQSLRPSHPPCLCPPLPPPSELVQGVAMSTTAVMPFRFFVQTHTFSVSPWSFRLSPI